MQLLVRSAAELWQGYQVAVSPTSAEGTCGRHARCECTPAIPRVGRPSAGSPGARLDGAGNVLIGVERRQHNDASGRIQCADTDHGANPSRPGIRKSIKVTSGR